MIGGKYCNSVTKDQAKDKNTGWIEVVCNKPVLGSHVKLIATTDNALNLAGVKV